MNVVDDWGPWIHHAVTHLRNLIRFDTTNPPHVEAPAATYVNHVLRDVGYNDPVLLERSPGRTNVIARYKGSGEGKPLLLFSHLDVVAADPEGWTHPPFSGALDQDFIWGRGAVDCKNVTALWLTLMMLLQHKQPQLKRDIIFAATADEEQDSSQGMAWLVKEHFELLDADAGITENGGMVIPFMGHQFMNVVVAEKGFLWCRIHAKGRAGHASVPHQANAAARLTRALSRATRARKPRLVDASASFLNSLTAPLSRPMRHGLRLLGVPALTNTLLRYGIKDNEIRENFSTLFHDTWCLTSVNAGCDNNPNVIPDRASAVIDIRFLPDRRLDDIHRELRSYFDADDFDIEVLDSSEANASSIETHLWDIIADTSTRRLPNIHLLPSFFPSTSDARFLRPLGMPVYGFIPLMAEDDLRRAHSVDERVSVASLERGLRLLWEIVTTYGNTVDEHSIPDLCTQAADGAPLEGGVSEGSSLNDDGAEVDAPVSL